MLQSAAVGVVTNVHVKGHKPTYFGVHVTVSPPASVPVPPVQPMKVFPAMPVYVTVPSAPTVKEPCVGKPTVDATVIVA